MARTAATTRPASTRTTATVRPVLRNFPYSLSIKGVGNFVVNNSNSLEDLFHQEGGGTYSAWFKQEASSALATFTFYSPTSSVQGWWLQLESSGTYPANRLRFGAAHTGSNRLYKTPLLSFPYNQWHNIIVSFDSRSPAVNPIICLDGVGQTITATGTGTEYLTDNGKQWRCSSMAGGNMVFAETRLIRGKSWTLAEMQNYYYYNVVPSGGLQAATWLFTEGTGTNVADTSGNGNTMALPVNTVWSATDLPSMGKLRNPIT